jgi:hypothetical protein
MTETLPEITENRNDVSVTVQMLVDEEALAVESSKTAIKPELLQRVGWCEVAPRVRATKRQCGQSEKGFR